MPVIPEYTAAAPVPAERDTAYANPQAFAAPGLATEREGAAFEHLGGAVEGVGKALGDLQQFHNTQYYLDNLADVQTKSFDLLENGKETARQSGNYQDFTKNLLGQVKGDMQQRIDNAPSGLVGARLNRRFSTLQDQITSRASVFEHTMAVEDAQAKTGVALDNLTKGVYRDHSLAFDNYAQGMTQIGADADRGLLNPEQRAKAEQGFKNALFGADIKARADSDPAGLAADFKAGKYDSFLDARTLESVAPLVSNARARAAGDAVAGKMLGGGGPSTGPDATLDPAGLVKKYESNGGNYNVGTGGADLSSAPRDPNGFPIWEGKLDPASGKRSHAAGAYQFQPGTWQQYAEPLGIHDFSPASQDAVFKAAYADKGYGHWAPYNPKLAAAIAGGGGGATAVGPAAPNLDAGLADVQQQVDRKELTPEEGDKASGTVARRYHEWSQATAQDRAQVTKEWQDGIAMLSSGRDWAPDEPRLRQFVPKEKADELVQLAGEARDAGNAVNRVQWASPQELIDLQAKTMGALNDPTDFARKQRQAKALGTALDERRKQLDPATGDPAAYVAAAPAVAAAQQGIDPQNPGPGTQAAIAASLTEQERLGVKPEDRRVLTKPQAAAIVHQIVTTDPGKTDMGAALDQAAQNYGGYWPLVFGDLVRGGLPAEAQNLAAMDRPEQAAARADYQRMLGLLADKGGSAKLKDSAPHDAASLIDQGLDERLSQFRATVRDPKLYDAVKEGVRHLAYYYAFNGAAGDAALANAYDGIVARKYDFDGSVRAPKGTLGAVERAGAAALGEVKASDLPDIGGNPELTPAQRQAVYLSAVQRGQWRVNEDDSGLVRTAKFRDGSELPARRADGSRIEFKFKDADRLGAVPALAPGADATGGATP
jgi:hypothetical protein